MIVAAAQAEAVAGDLDANISTAAELIDDAAQQDARLVVLPEAFLTGYDLGVFAGDLPAVGDLQLHPVTDAVRRGSLTAIVGVALQEDGRKTLSSLVIRPSGAVEVGYDKQHLCGDEKLHFAPGQAGSSISIDSLEFGLSICYDGCFPEHARAAADDGAIGYLNSAAYFVGGEQRRDIYYAARAVENGMYVVFSGLNGSCGGADFCGGSAIYDPEGRPLARMGTESGVVLAEVDPHLVTTTRQQHPMLADHLAGLGSRRRLEHVR